MDALIFFIVVIVVTLFVNSLFLPTPISDTGSVRYRTLPVMTLGLILINCMVFMVWQAREYYAANSISELQPYVDKVWTYGYRASFMREGISVGAFTTFTSMFMHADFWHLFGNMIYLWTFGRRLEDACGAWRYLLFYLGAGMVANMGSVLLNPSTVDLPGIGASGAIAGVMGAYLVLFPGAMVDCIWGIGSVLRVPYAIITNRPPIWSWTVKLPAWLLLGYFAIREAIPSFGVIANGKDVGGVNNLAHLMGFLAAVGILLFVRKDLFMRFLQGRTL